MWPGSPADVIGGVPSPHTAPPFGRFPQTLRKGNVLQDLNLIEISSAQQAIN